MAPIRDTAAGVLLGESSAHRPVCEASPTCMERKTPVRSTRSQSCGRTVIFCPGEVFRLRISHISRVQDAYLSHLSSARTIKPPTWVMLISRILPTGLASSVSLFPLKGAARKNDRDKLLPPRPKRAPKAIPCADAVPRGPSPYRHHTAPWTDRALLQLTQALRAAQLVQPCCKSCRRLGRRVYGRSVVQNSRP